jgi:hypothetical protein
MAASLILERHPTGYLYLNSKQLGHLQTSFLLQQLQDTLFIRGTQDVFSPDHCNTVSPSTSPVMRYYGASHA